MDKNKTYMIVAPIVVSLVCIILAANLILMRSKLNSEAAQKAELNNLVVSFTPQLSNLQARYDEQVRIANEMQRSLDTLRREAQGLRDAKADLESRLNSALAALQTPAEAKAVE